jgi:hypothetical protein
MASIGAGAATHDVVFDDTPIALHATDILDRLEREGGELGFEHVFIGRTRAEMIGLFLALLELMRQQRVRIVQEAVLGPIRVILLSTEPITIGAEWEPAIREAVLGPTVETADDVAAEATDDVEAGDELDGIELDDEESFAELDKIKTDVDIDAILKQDESTAEVEDEEQTS